MSSSGTYWRRKNQGVIGANWVDSGHVEILEFFAYRHVSGGNCKRPRREAAIAEGNNPLPTRGFGPWGSVESFPSGVWGGAPCRKRRNFEHFMPKWSAFWDVVNLTFLT